MFVSAERVMRVGCCGIHCGGPKSSLSTMHRPSVTCESRIWMTLRRNGQCLHIMHETPLHPDSLNGALVSTRAPTAGFHVDFDLRTLPEVFGMSSAEWYCNECCAGFLMPASMWVRKANHIRDGSPIRGGNGAALLWGKYLKTDMWLSETISLRPTEKDSVRLPTSNSGQCGNRTLNRSKTTCPITRNRDIARSVLGNNCDDLSSLA